MKKSLLVALLLAVVLPLQAHAATFKGGESFDLGSTETSEGNLYVGARTVTLGGTMTDDAFAAGANVAVTGTVDGDLAAAGGTLTLLGDVVGDLRAAGGSLTIGGTVGGDLLAAGGSITLLPDALISGETRLAGGVITVNAPISGDLTVYGGDVRIDNVVEGNVHSFAKKLTLGPDAVIKGSLTQEGPADAVLENGAAIEGAHVYTYNPLSKHVLSVENETSRKSAGMAVAGAVFGLLFIKFLSQLLASTLAAVWFNKRSQVVVDRTMRNFGIDLLTGILTLAAAPIALVLLFSTLIGWTVTGILAVSLALTSMLAVVYSPINAGALVRKLYAKSSTYAADWKSAVLGSVLLALVVLVPVLGWLAAAAFFLATFGSFVRLAYDNVVLKR